MDGHVMTHATLSSAGSLGALDPDVANLLALAQQAGYPPFEALTPAQARKAYAASWDAMQSPRTEVASVHDVEIAAPHPLQLRVYRGQGTSPSEVLPCLLFLHGGGWVIGNLDSHDRMCRHLANVARICVVAVDYRLAPEHPYPAAVDDAAAALRWIALHADTLHIDPHALGVGGDSAGGNLAAVLALMARNGELPALCYQALLYPVTDLTCSSASYQRITHGYPLTAATMHYFIGHYTPERKRREEWRASPLKAHSLQGVAPALVLTVSHDPLCDEGVAYAQRLDAAGVPVAALHFNDHIHGVLSQGRMVAMSNTMAQQVFTMIGDALHHTRKRLSATQTRVHAD
jgi:acetyl esterase